MASLIEAAMGGACLGVALLAGGAIASPTPAAAQSVRIGVEIDAEDGYGRRGDNEAAYHQVGDWDRGDDWDGGGDWDRGDKWRRRGDWDRHDGWRGRRWHRRPVYFAPPVYVAPRCYTKVIRTYDEYDGSSVTRRIRRCR